ncbi:DUF547 domain-containing protein [Fulvivirgaceae bacterium BMA12]|uniref:DUF547 domain-containing protein n=1 Tax=Agaribacillus aureus TaxID=3051825 RepID=A0ABT8LCB1_9BACT|nr:DUF547 domain-containing protein [Fulvivirgaceae bacterium BMA12]
MKKLKHLLLITLISYGFEASAGDFFSLADQFFSKYVKDGKVAYAAIKSNQDKELNVLLKEIASFDLKGADKNTAKAFMINSYNILAIKGIVNKYPVKSPMNINNFFDQKSYMVAGEKLSLNQLEKERLYPVAKDPRLHFVLVCAAQSCPKLASYAYVPDKLEQQIDAVTRQTLNDPEFIRVKGNKLEVSEIFNWYKSDFTKEAKSILRYINQYLETKVDDKTKIGYYTYNWNINDQ